MACRAGAMLRSLLRFLLDVSSDSALTEPLRQALMSHAGLCLRLLERCCRGNLQVSPSGAAAAPAAALRLNRVYVSVRLSASPSAG